MRKFKIFRLLCLIAYLGCVAVLIFESALDSKASSSQSNAVGGGIANIFNDLSGDKTIAKAPESVNITNKTTNVFHPGETYKLNYEAMPVDSTYKSYIFTSSNENIAEVDHTGLVKFKSEGFVTITIQNEHEDYTNISDSVSFTVKDIVPQQISLSLNIEKNEANIYELYVGQSYTITSKVLPENASDKAITFTSDDSNDYIELSNDGVITPLKSSLGDVITIIASTKNNIKASIQIEIKIVEVIHIPLEEISTIESITLVASQSYSPKITFTPLDASNKGYTLTSSNTSYVSISGKSIKALKPTESEDVTITVTSVENPSITATFKVIVNPEPELTSYNATINSPIYVGSSKNITISKITPNYANTSSKTFKSADTSIATVNSSGKVTGVSEGITTITVTINGISKKLTVEIIQKPVDQTKDFEVNIKKQPIITTNTEIDFNDYFEPKNFIDNDNNPYNPESTLISFTINPDHGILTGSKMVFTACGVHSITITHNISGIEKQVEFTVIDDYEVLINNEKYTNETINLNVNDSLKLKINNLSLYEHIFNTPGYIVSIDNTEIASLISYDDYYKINALSNGLIKITITPTLNDTPIASASITIDVKIEHVLSKSINVNATLNNYLGTTNNLDISDGTFTMFISETVNINAVPNLETTLSHINYTVENPNILTISNDGIITPHNTGITKLYIVDILSGAEKEISIGVFNIIEFEETPISVTGVDAKYDSQKSIFSITNGYSGNIVLNFSEFTTYKEATYTVKNEKILEIGSNGVITPLKEGTTSVIIEIDDGMHDEPEKVFEITIKVVRQKAIKDIASFLSKIRKGVGHFGAFLVLGIFSTLTFLLFFQNKHWIWSVPLNIAQGFRVAALTEFIQTFVPGRYGCLSDVMLDFSGFIISASILTVIILARAIIIYIKKKKTQN